MPKASRRKIKGEDRYRHVAPDTSTPSSGYIKYLAINLRAYTKEFELCPLAS